MARSPLNVAQEAFEVAADNSSVISPRGLLLNYDAAPSSTEINQNRPSPFEPSPIFKQLVRDPRVIRKWLLDTWAVIDSYW